jgi:hypothetical protein
MVSIEFDSESYIPYFVNKARSRLLSVSVFVGIQQPLQHQWESQISEIKI